MERDRIHRRTSTLNASPTIGSATTLNASPVIASIAGLAFNVVADPIVGYFYKQYILGQPQELAQALAKMSAAATFINAVVSVILVAIIYNAVRPVLIKSHLITITNNKNQVA